MPVHDWTRVTAGVFHAFHNAWIASLQASLNGGLLPSTYYALGEQRSGEISPDLLTLVIRHVTGDRIVALVEIVSTANKHNAATVEDFTEKVIAALREGIHVLVVDLHPPTKHDPRGMHGVVWDELLADPYEPPAGLPLAMASYCAKTPVKAYVEPVNVGSSLIDMPLFLTRTHYILVPLEQTYAQAWAGVPERWRRVIDAPAAPRGKS